MLIEVTPLLEFYNKFTDKEFNSKNAGGVKVSRAYSTISREDGRYAVDLGWTVGLSHTFVLDPDTAEEYAKLIQQAVEWCRANPNGVEAS